MVGEAQESVSPQGDANVNRAALRAEQDAEYQRAVEADEARQRLEGPVDEAAVRAARLRHWLQSP